MSVQKKWQGLVAVLIALALCVCLFMLGQLSSDESASDYSGAFPVYITEVMTYNSNYPAPDGRFCDWLELHNSSGYAIDLSGYGLTDNSGRVKFSFPLGCIIGSGEYLIVWCGVGVYSELTADFSLKRSGGEEILFLNHQSVTVDSVKTIESERNCSLVRSADGTLAICDSPTPGFSNDEFGRAQFEASMLLQDSPLRISELMAKNEATINDSFGTFSDWIELQNVGAETLDLAGWYLSDDAERPYLWQLPEIALASGEYIVIYASGRDCRVDDEIHAGFALSSGGGTLSLRSPLGKLADELVWPALESDLAWSLDDGVWGATLRATPGFPNSDAGFERLMAARGTPALAINEVVTANDSTLPRGGVYYDWVELRNTSSSAISLSGWHLSDDADEPLLFALPDVTLQAGEMFIVFCSGDESLSAYGDTHAGFSLNASEDRLYLFSPEGEVKDFVYLSGIPRGGSMGRIGGEGGFFLFETPTPGADNCGGLREVSASPFALTDQGIYDEPVTLELQAEGDIYYTTDGSTPSASSQKYTAPLTLCETTIIRALSCESGKLPSAVTSLSYFIAEEHTLPVVSVVTDPDNLWSDETGIYISGNHTNYNQNWERDANFSLFELDGGGISYDVGIKLHGATSRFVTDKKTFKIMFRGRYGQSVLDYDLFGDGEVTRFGSFLLRAGVDMVYPTLIKDDLFALLAKEGSDSLLSMNSRYCTLYLNGEYWGIYAIREAMSEEYYAAYHEVSPDSVTVITPSETYGTGYQDILTYIHSHNLADDEAYEHVSAQVDLENLIDWCIIEAYAGNRDIWNNLRYYNSPEGDGKWRYALVDLDLTWIGFSDGFGDTSLQGAHSELPLALLQNGQFRTLFMERCSELTSGVLSDEHVISKISELASMIREEIPRDRERWGGSLSQWETQVEFLCNFVDRGKAAQIAKNCALELNMTAEEIEFYFGEVLD